jgi:SPP1 gp7 family putative phage head morphogenesis protein
MNIWTAADKHRRALIARDEQTLKALSSLYDDARKRINEKLKALELRMVEHEATGGVVSEAWLKTEFRYITLIQQIETEMAALSPQAVRLTQAAQADVLALGNAHAIEQIGLQVGVSFNKLPVEALRAFAGLSSAGSPLRTLFDEFGAQTSNNIRRALFSGIASGQGARETARHLRGLLDGNGARALTIARTETTRAYRVAAQRTMEESGIVTGKRRVAAKSLRTCASCLSLDSHIYPLDAAIDSHPNCRCVFVAWVDPKLRTFAIPERETGEQWLRRQSPEDQEKVLGIAGAAAYRGRRLPLRAWVGETDSQRWGITRSQRSLRQAENEPRVQIPSL